MKKIILIMLISAGLLAAAGTVRGTVKYTASASSGTWSGNNSSLTGSVTVSPLSGKVCIRTDQWDSGNTRRDSHTRDMFEAGTYPHSCFTILGFEGGGLRGNLELHGVSRPVVFTGNLRQEGGRVVFTGKTVIIPDDFGLKRPVLMGMQVNKEVTAEVTAEGGL